MVLRIRNLLRRLGLASNAGGGERSPMEPVSSISDVFDVKNVSIAAWNGYAAAASFTWDDTQPSHGAIAEIFDQHQLRASFFVHPGAERWEELRGMYQCISQEGHEVGNHSYSHTDLTTLAVEDVRNEVVRAKDAIQRVTGRYPISFVHPYNKTNGAVDSVVFRHQHVTRIRSKSDEKQRVFLNGVGTTTLDEVKEKIDKAVHSKGWFVFAGHGIDGNGWEPVSGKILLGTLKYINEANQKIWVDTLGAVGLYEHLHRVAQVRTKYTKDEMSVKVSGVDLSMFNGFRAFPVTIEIPTMDQVALRESYSMFAMPDEALIDRTSRGRVLVRWNLLQTREINLSRKRVV